MKPQGIKSVSNHSNKKHFKSVLSGAVNSIIKFELFLFTASHKCFQPEDEKVKEVMHTHNSGSDVRQVQIILDISNDKEQNKKKERNS